MRWPISTFIFKCSQIVGLLYLSWLGWNEHSKDTLVALRNINNASVLQAAVSGTVIGLAVYVLQKRYSWLRESVYGAIIPRLKQTYRENLQMLSEALNSRLGSFFTPYQPTNWKVRWVLRILSLLVWPIACVSLASDIYNDETGWLAVPWFMSLLLLLAMFGLKLRNLLAGTLLALWLGYVDFTQSETQVAVHAFTIGVCITLWSLWEQWQDKIKKQPMEPPAIE